MNDGTTTSSPGPTPMRLQREAERVGAVGHADDVAHAEVVGELALERRHLGAEDVAAGVEHLGRRGVQRARAAARAALRCRTGGRGKARTTLERLVFVVASITDTVANWATDVVRDLGLPGIFGLMTAESACIPIPSEATMLFAGFDVHARASSRCSR